MSSDTELDFLEQQIPELATMAARKAYLDTLSSGNSVLEVIEGKIFEIFPDGSKKLLKQIETDVTVKTDRKLVIS